MIILSLLTNDLVFIASTFNQLSLIYKYRQQLATTEPNHYSYAPNPVNWVDPFGLSCKEGSSGFGIMDAIHTALDAGGLVPAVGIIPDALNALIYLIEGDMVNAAFAGAAMVPIAGQAATATKYGAKAVDAASTTVVATKATKANNKLWQKKEVIIPKTGRVKGNHDPRNVYQRDKLIDINKKDVLGRTNRDRMKSGLAPIGPDGKPLQLHHNTQIELNKRTGKRGSLTEIEETLHQQKTAVLHQPGQKSFRNDRVKDKSDYRQQRNNEGKVDIESRDQYSYTDKKGKKRSKLNKKVETQDNKDFELFKKDYWKLREKEL